MESSIKLKIEILFDPVLLEPLSFPKELKTWHWNDLGLPVFTVAKPLNLEAAYMFINRKQRICLNLT